MGSRLLDLWRWLRRSCRADDADDGSAELLIRIDGDNWTAAPARRALRRGLGQEATAVAGALNAIGHGRVLLPASLARLVRVRGARQEQVALEDLGFEDQVLAPIGAAAAIEGRAPAMSDWDRVHDLEGVRLAEVMGEGKGVNLAFRAVLTLVRSGRPTLVTTEPLRDGVRLQIAYPEADVYGLTVSGTGWLDAAISGEHVELARAGELRVVTRWDAVPGVCRQGWITWRVLEPVGGMSEQAVASLKAQWPVGGWLPPRSAREAG